jgi:zinc transport system substrate-binding protein
VAKALEDIDPEGRKYYEKNLQKYIAQDEALEKRISSILSSLPAGSSFLVFHPSWGYFADEFGLRQVAMETEGKEPSAKELMSLIKRMKKSGARAIVVQPEFSDKSARLLAKELSIPVVAVSPLAYDWQNSLLRVARAIAGREN